MRNCRHRGVLSGGHEERTELGEGERGLVNELYLVIRGLRISTKISSVIARW